MGKLSTCMIHCGRANLSCGVTPVAEVHAFDDVNYILVGGLDHFLCSPIAGMMIQSD